MGKSRRRRYAVHDPELDAAIEVLIDRAAPDDVDSADREYVRQLAVSTLLLLRDGTSRSELKLVSNAMKELRHAFRTFAPYQDMRKVAIFGSARTDSESADWRQAEEFAQRIVEAGWMVITGAGGGIMAAAQGGAGRDASFGVNIRLPFEQQANETIEGDHKLINFRYFFTRKVVFVKESHALVLFPGGFGTHDEGFESLTLMQTGKSEVVPVVFVDAPGGDYWRDWLEYVRSHLGNRGLISPEDLDLFKVTDSIDVAMNEVLDFYRNYHSSRFIGDRLILRVHRRPDPETLASLTKEFSDLLVDGAIEAGDPLPEEEGAVPNLPRVMLQFNRRKVGQLRRLIDRLNQLTEEPPPPREARRREIIATPMPVEQEEAELD